jgi:hypothetical protein
MSLAWGEMTELSSSFFSRVDVTLLPIGHDARVVGDESIVVVDFQGMLDYAKAAR